ncbi:rhamnulokinase [Humibacter ginsengisoli]
MTAGTLVVAIDLGATSGRVILARVSGDGPGVLELEEVARFPNEPVQREDGLHWDIAALREAVLNGLTDARAAAERTGERIASIGIDSWAVDYGVLREGQLMAAPFHYRDSRTARGVERVHALVPFEELYARNGLQFLPFNTVYQFAADRLVSEGLGESILLIPDLFAYWLTGARVAEETNASTTGLVPAAEAEPRWDAELAERVGVPAGILPRIVRPGDVIGTLSAEAAERTGLPQSTPVVAVGSHDTASAVVGTPLGVAGSVFVSCGTWGLVGVESTTPVLTADARDSGFTNERGVDGTTRLLHNVMGLWVLNECVRAWQEAGADADLAALLDAASAPHVPFTVFDIDDPRLMPPGDMPARVEQLCREAGGLVPRGMHEFVRSIVESLADAFARAAAQASALAGTPLAAINIVGGGARNALLCQATADRAGVPVIAGPVEATAIGNVLVQARAAGAITGGLAELRALVVATQPTTQYGPRSTLDPLFSSGDEAPGHGPIEHGPIEKDAFE